MSDSAAQPETATILVVDDMPDNLRLLAMIMESEGYTAVPAASGKEALEAVAKAPPDLVLLDINMPEMNGYETCRRLKEKEPTRGIPVIFISGLQDTTDKVKAFECGGVDYITKPFHYEEVVARVRTQLSVRRLQLQLEVKNRALQQSYEDLRKLEGMRDNLTHMVVHDLRSPLVAVVGFLDMLRAGSDPPLEPAEAGKYIETAHSTAARMVEMVSSILDVSRLEGGQLELHRATCDLREVAQDAFHSCEALLAHCHAAVAPPPEPVLVECDRELIRRVLVNLLSNAAKYTPANGCVGVRFEASPGEARVLVSDSGPGIPAAFQTRIFEKFGQVEGAARRRRYSTGLGLTFCKLAIEAHGGQVGVRSEVGKGSTFFFTLQRQATSAAPGG